jgi:tetratricopeptide (TPR) repeat protein
MVSPDEILATVRDALAAGDLELAEQSLREASRTWKREPEFAVRHAGVLVRLGKHAQALKVYRKAMKRAPERLDACKGAAECAIKIGNGKLAEKLYSRATGLGMNLDEVALGIARSYILRSQHQMAWEKASVQFKASGNKSKDLHNLLKEISAQVGSSVPQLDDFDSSDIDLLLSDVRREISDPRLASHTFEAGSIEAMAGVDSTTLLENTAIMDDDLLSESRSDAGTTNLGIDLSALETSKDEVSQVSQDQIEEKTPPQHSESTNVESEVNSISTAIDLDIDSLPSSDLEPKATEPKTSTTTLGDDPFDDWPDI